MPTEIYSNKLELFIEADSHSGSNGAAVSEAEDNSGANRDFTGSGTYPTIKTNAVNGKKSFVFTRSTNPLVWTGTPFKAVCGYLVVKINSLLNYDGILTGATDNPLLVANHGNEKFFNLRHPYQEIRVNDRLYRQNAHKDEFPPVIQDEWQIIFFNLYQPITISSLQIGQDRNFTDRKSDMEFAALALYSNYWIADGGERALRKNYESFAWSYQIPIEDVFPFQASNADAGDKKAFVLSDGQRRPIKTQKSNPFYSYERTFNNRNYKEFDEAETYYDARAYTGKTFFFRDFRPLGFDKIYRFDDDANFQDRGALSSQRSYGFSLIEDDLLPDKYIPSKPDFTGVPIVDTVPPSNVTGVTASNIQPGQADYGWNAATDNIAVTGYQIQRAENSSFTGQIAIFNLGNVTSYRDKTVAANTTYYIRVKAHDAQPNYSTGWSNVYSFTTPAIPDTTAPTVNLSPPPSTVNGTQVLSATATDTESGVQRVDFYIINSDGTNPRYLGTQSAPNPSTNIYSFNWNTTVDGIGNPITDGLYTLSAISYDHAGNMSVSPSFRPNITVANNANAAPTMAALEFIKGDNQITVNMTFADADGTVVAVYLESSSTGANPNTPFNTADDGWTVRVNGETPDTATTHQFILTGLGEGETAHFRAWVEDNDGAISNPRRFGNSASNPPAGTSFALAQDGFAVVKDGLVITK